MSGLARDAIVAMLWVRRTYSQFRCDFKVVMAGDLQLRY